MSLVMATVNVVLWLAAPGSLGDLGQWQVFYFHRLTVSYAIFCSILLSLQSTICSRSVPQISV